MRTHVALVVVVLAGTGAGLLWPRRAQVSPAPAVLAVTEIADREPRPEVRLAGEPAASLPPAAAPRGAATVPAAAKATPSPAMMNDPETRALMRKQQQQAGARQADQLLGRDFARDWSLSPQQVTRAKELLRERGAAGADMTTAMLFDGLDDDALAQKGREARQRIEAANAALRETLGSEGFDALRERERVMDEKSRVKRLREELSTADAPLTGEQEASLLGAMGAERQAYPFRVDYSDPATYDYEHLREFFGEANLQAYYEDMEQLNARIAERAALFLSAAQLEEFKKIQEDRLEKGRLTVKMTTELFNRRRGN